MFAGTLISATDHTRTTGNELVGSGTADLVAFGRAFIANPDLVQRFADRSALNVPDRETFYTGGSRGYTDYPLLTDQPTGLRTVAGDRAVGDAYAQARARMRTTWST